MYAESLRRACTAVSSMSSADSFSAEPRRFARSLSISSSRELPRGQEPIKQSCSRRARRRQFLYVEHVASGTDLFRVICDRDMEGVVVAAEQNFCVPHQPAFSGTANRMPRDGPSMPNQTNCQWPTRFTKTFAQLFNSIQAKTVRIPRMFATVT